jgi:quinoprotein glucose dehydrogenase
MTSRFLVFVPALSLWGISCASTPKPSTPEPVSATTTPETVEAASTPSREVFTPSEAAMADARKQLSLVKVPKGMHAEVWAAEPLLENAVSFAFDELGRAYIAETFRVHTAVLDIRSRHDWPSETYKKTMTDAEKKNIRTETLDAELGARTIEDRERLIRKYFVDELNRFTDASEVVKRVVDSDGDGFADQATRFAEGFNGILDGALSGVLARKGKVFATNIPSVWSLQDHDNDGFSDSREELSTGYGVRFQFFGHDMHGLRMGHDGRVYFSIGDRGAHVETREGKILDIPETGGVFRCDPDGSNLELFHVGLRNPQELAFDEHGNWFTGDNNSDGGDQARVVQLVEGGDSGWHVGYQSMERPNPRGPWNAEKQWHPAWKDQAAYIVPPVANLANGPAGIVYHPGSGAAPDFKKHFFLVDFRGQASSSGVLSFRLEEKGAGFKVAKHDEFIWGVLATDVDFGPDGNMYVLDWVRGWDMTGQARIHRIRDTEPAANIDLRPILSRDLDRADDAELTSLLGHADQRVRLEAQFSLAKTQRAEVLRTVAINEAAPVLARLHAVWGAGQLLRQTAPGPVVEWTAALLHDKNAEVRAQAARVLGDASRAPAIKAKAGLLLPLLKDPSPRVRFYTAITLGNLGHVAAFAELVALAARDGDRDPLLRHASVMGLVGTGSVEEIIALGSHKSRAVRMAAVVALRRKRNAAVANFLNDKDLGVVREAARAINDARIVEALPHLAALGDKTGAILHDAPILLRIVEANMRMGDAIGVGRLSRIATNNSIPPEVRTEAIASLATWSAPRPRNRVTGLYQPDTVANRDEKLARTAAETALPKILKASNNKAMVPVQKEAVAAALALKIASVGAQLEAIANGKALDPSLRLASVNALATLGDSRIDGVLTRIETDSDERLRLAAMNIRIARDATQAVPIALSAMEKGGVKEKQMAIAILGKDASPEGSVELKRLGEQQVAGTLPAGLMLDVIEALAARTDDASKAIVAAIESKRPATETGPFIEALEGGDAEVGQRIFSYHAQVQCRRCHTTEGHGVTVGPGLESVGKNHDRNYLLEAVVFPSKHFAPGFESVMLTMKDGGIHGGTVKSESKTDLSLESIEEGLVSLQKTLIAERERGVSGMPEGFGYILSRRELRDLVAYLASLKN